MTNAGFHKISRISLFLFYYGCDWRNTGNIGVGFKVVVADKIVKVFEMVKAPPLVYLGSIEPKILVTFLHGFYGCYRILGRISGYRESNASALRERGWVGVDR